MFRVAPRFAVMASVLEAAKRGELSAEELKEWRKRLALRKGVGALSNASWVNRALSLNRYTAQGHDLPDRIRNVSSGFNGDL